MKEIRKLRIATVKASSRRFVVDRIDIPRDGTPAKVYCFGDIVAAKEARNGGASFTYSGARTFLRDAVDIAEVEFTWAVCRELWQEAMAVRAAKMGKGLDLRTSRTGRTTKAVGLDLGADQLLRRAAEAEAEGKMELAAELLKAAEKVA
jgi:hypothetical protein